MRSSTRSSIIWSRCAAPGASALIAACVLAPAAARDDVVRIVGSRLPASQALPAQEVRLLRADELHSRPSVPDAVRALPELHVDQPGAPAGFGSLYLRGADPNHAVILLDGVKLNDPTNARGGGFDFGSLDARAIDRIEILPGASSAIYGADAMSGVVNILTAPPRGSGARFGGGFGGLGYRTLHTAYDAPRWRVGAFALDDGGKHELGEKSIRALTMRAAQLALHAWRHESLGFPEDSGGPRLAVLRELERRQSDNVLGALQAYRRRGEADLRAQFGILHQASDISSPGVAPGPRDPAGVPPSVSNARFSRWNATATARLGNALLGAEYQREDGTLESTLFFGPSALPANFALERDTRSLFAEAQVPFRRGFSAHGGLRLDDVEGYRVQTSALAALRLRLRGEHELGFTIGTGFKPPSFFALGHPLVGNAALVPEESESMELSIASPEKRPFRQRAAVFRTDYTNLIDFDAGPPPRLVNRDSVRIEGVQYSAAATLGPLETAVGATRFHYELPEAADPLRSRPRSKLTAQVSSAVSDTTSLRLSAVRVGQVFDSSIPTGGRYLDPYIVVDATLGYRSGRNEAQLALDNVFDRDYQQFIGFPAPGRRLRLQLAIGL